MEVKVDLYELKFLSGGVIFYGVFIFFRGLCGLGKSGCYGEDVNFDNIVGKF